MTGDITTVQPTTTKKPTWL